MVTSLLLEDLYILKRLILKRIKTWAGLVLLCWSATSHQCQFCKKKTKNVVMKS